MSGEAVEMPEHLADFTEANYLMALGLAAARYRFADYRCIPWGERFVLWRHDIDYSLNRALTLARHEAGLGLVATYFVNLRSEFYNPLEGGQASIIRQILALGHRLGLHFDAGLKGVTGEEMLEQSLRQDADFLEAEFGVRPDAFSFHSPTDTHLAFDRDSYAGLPNCYSKRLRDAVPYCSDSNGYWRFRRLVDVLESGNDPCLQVLTHPGWWQVEEMPPRSRILRCAQGRAMATIREYDRALLARGRVNVRGSDDALLDLASVGVDGLETVEILWGLGHVEDALLVLRRVAAKHLPIARARRELSEVDSICRATLLAEREVAREEISRCLVQLCNLLGKAMIVERR